VTPETPAEQAAFRDAADAAWAGFLKTPAWDALRREFEQFRQKAINQGGKMGLGCCDRAVLAGELFVYETFLSAPTAALQRLRMRHDRHTPEGPASSTAPVED
jgi:hypothetical protein